MIHNSRFRFIFYLLLLLLIVNLGIAQVTHADAGGHFLIPELPAGVIIDPDDCSASDWPTEFLSFNIESLTNPGTILGNGRMVISHPADLTATDGEELYVYIEMTADSVFDPNDLVVLMFDNSHDHAAPDTSSYDASDDRGISFTRDENVLRGYGLLSSANEDEDETAFDSNRVCINGDVGGGWLIEAELLPSDLGLNSFSVLAGAAIFTQNQDGGSDPVGTWPHAFALADIDNQQSNWANLVTRAPIDYILVIDQSGSMSGAKWDSVRQAGDNFALILSVMRDDDLDSEFTDLGMGGDQLGLVTFTTNHGSPGAATDIPLSAIPANPMDHISGELPVSPGGSTPMIAGVQQAIDIMGGATSILADPLGRNRVIMLLSDGMHNSPSTAFDPATDYTLGCSSNSPVRVHTVAVGTDTTVSTDNLDMLKDCFAGNIGPNGSSSDTTIYNITGNTSGTGPQLTARLTQFFVETLLPEYRMNLLQESDDNFTIRAGERRLLLFAFWDTTGPGISLSILPPGSETSVMGECEESLGYCYLLLENPIAGEYTEFEATDADGQFVLLDLRTEARFGIDNRPHGTSSDITLRARLRDDGQPILGANVRVDITRPSEGFGTFIVTHGLECNIIEPSLPSVDMILPLIFPNGSIPSIPPPDPPSPYPGLTPSVPYPGSTPSIPLPDPPSSTPEVKLFPFLAKGVSTQIAPDIPGARFLLMERLLGVCQKEDLERVEDTNLQLHDDGTHGDAEAGDGIYTLSFTNTQIEGSYVFRFRADGATADGQPFSRIKEVAEYIRLDVDPAQTSIGSLILQQEGNLVWKAHYVLPQSAAGEYLGPGYIHQVDFTTTGGVWSGPVHDLGNGYYVRVLQYDETQGEPGVITIVQGKPIGEDGLFGLPDRFWFVLSLLLVLIILILLILLFICWRRKQRRTGTA